MTNTVPKCPICAVLVGDTHEMHEQIDAFAKDNSHKALELMRCHFMIEKQKMEIQKLKAARKR